MGCREQAPAGPAAARGRQVCCCPESSGARRPSQDATAPRALFVRQRFPNTAGHAQLRAGSDLAASFEPNGWVRAAGPLQPACLLRPRAQPDEPTRTAAAAGRGGEGTAGASRQSSSAVTQKSSLCKELAKRSNVTLISSLSPERLTGFLLLRLPFILLLKQGSKVVVRKLENVRAGTE